MLSVGSEETYRILWIVSRYLFAFLFLLLFLLAFFWLLTEQKNRRERLQNLPGAGTVGELIVLSGSRNLPENTWFPVPREGILGSVRSCDLVVPCPGVRSQHLDFSWQDGLGLLLHPRSGCEILVNGIPATCRTDAKTVPMTHGSVLQIGQAVLRLHLFAALDLAPSVNSQQEFPDISAALPDINPVMKEPVTFPVPPVSPIPPEFSSPSPPVDDILPTNLTAPGRSVGEHTWKEDWSE